MIIRTTIVSIIFRVAHKSRGTNCSALIKITEQCAYILKYLFMHKYLYKLWLQLLSHYIMLYYNLWSTRFWRRNDRLFPRGRQLVTKPRLRCFPFVFFFFFFLTRSGQYALSTRVVYLIVIIIIINIHNHFPVVLTWPDNPGRRRRVLTEFPYGTLDTTLCVYAVRTNVTYNHNHTWVERYDGEIAIA